MKASIILGIVFGACVYTMAATWTGGGDGMSWGDPANWGGAVPGATEVVSVSTGAGAKTISIDATDRVIGELQLTGVGKLTITGAGVLSLSKLTSAIDVTFNAPVTFKDGSNTINNKIKVIEFLKPVTVLGSNKGFTFASETSGNKMYVHFRDAFTAPGTTIYMMMGNTGSSENTSVHFHGKLTAAKLSCCNDGYRSGWCYLYAENNEIGYTEVCYGGIVLVGKNALPASTALNWSNYYRSSNPTFYSYNFTGTDQIAEAVRCPDVFNDTRNRCHFLRTIGKPSKLTLKGQGDAVANCEVCAGISLVWDPLGDYTQEFICQTNLTEGPIEVRRGTFKVGDGASFASVTNIVIGAGATFDVSTGVSGALADLVSIDVGAGGRFKISSASVDVCANWLSTATLAADAVIEANSPVVFNQVKYDDVLVPAGVYGANAVPADWVRGSATVKVLDGDEFSDEVRTWTGAGDGVTWDNDANWDTVAPRSYDTARFPVNAIITSDVEFRGGLRTIVIESGKNVRLTGCVAGVADMVKTGPGELYLSGSNSFSGTLTIKSGRVHAIGEYALGDNDRGAIDVSKENDPEDWNLVLGGVTLRKELIVRNKNDTANGWRQAVRCMTDTTNIILGKLTAPNSYFRMGVDDGAKFIIAGGATLSEAPIIGYGNGAEVIVRNIPISRKIYQDVNTGGRFIYDCAGNSISHHSTTDYARGMQMYMETRVDGALDDSSWFLMGLENGKGVSILDLCGTVQRISRIEAIVQGGVLAQSGIVTSDMPATLTMTSDKTYTNSCIFAGAASLEQAGGGVLYLTASSTSTGMLHIANGTLVLADSVQNGAAWAGEEVRISGGVIDVRHATSFAKNVDFNFVGETGKINIPSGINIQCRYIYADGLRQKIGVYTADNFGDHVSGGGAIVSRGLANGTVFLLR